MIFKNRIEDAIKILEEEIEKLQLCIIGLKLELKERKDVEDKRGRVK